MTWFFFFRQSNFLHGPKRASPGETTSDNFAFQSFRFPCVPNGLSISPECLKPASSSLPGDTVRVR